MNKKLERKFNKYIKSYQSWCGYYGYNSKDTHTILWFFNRKKMAYKDDGNYLILYQDKAYRSEELINLFAR